MSRREGWVYFIREGDGGKIKIGKADNVEGRLRTFQTASPYRLRVLHQEPGGYAREAELHRRFRRHRIRGEWFEPHDDILDYLSAAPKHRRGPRRGWEVPWPTIGRILGVVPVGAWRILAGMAGALFTRRRRRHRIPAALGMSAIGTSTLAYATLDQQTAVMVAAAVVGLVCVVAGRD